MKKYLTIYYLLFFLLILGAFASMAQNGYGMKILGGVAIALGLIFIRQFVEETRNDEERDAYVLAELGCLILLAAIFALRVFYIHFSYIEWIFSSVVFILFLLYGRKMVIAFRLTRPHIRTLSVYVLIFYGSILFFLVSLLMVNTGSQIPAYTAAVGIVLALSLLPAGFFTRKWLVEGVERTGISLISRFRDNAILLLSIFFLIFTYNGLTRTGILPGMYSDEYPPAYFNLVNQATTGKEKPVEDRFRYMEFKDRYTDFVKKNLTEEK